MLMVHLSSPGQISILVLFRLLRTSFEVSWVAQHLDWGLSSLSIQPARRMLCLILCLRVICARTLWMEMVEPKVGVPLAFGRQAAKTFHSNRLGCCLSPTHHSTSQRPIDWKLELHHRRCFNLSLPLWLRVSHHRHAFTMVRNLQRCRTYAIRIPPIAPLLLRNGSWS